MSAFVTYEFIGIYSSLFIFFFFVRKTSPSLLSDFISVYCFFSFRFIFIFFRSLHFLFTILRDLLWKWNSKLLVTTDFVQSNWKIMLNFFLNTSNRIDSRKNGMRIISVDMSSKQKCVSFVTHSEAHLLYLVSEPKKKKNGFKEPNMLLTLMKNNFESLKWKILRRA